MRILFEVLLIIIIAGFAFKAFGWIFPKKGCEKGRNEEQSKPGEVKPEVVEGQVVEDQEGSNSVE
ncbi:MAG: hypothetical protein ABIH87_03430 [bacterium]